MSMHSHQMMTNHHVTGIWTHIGETLHIWRQRYQERHARWTERDLHKVGLSWSDIANEVGKVLMARLNAAVSHVKAGVLAAIEMPSSTDTIQPRPLRAVGLSLD